MMERILKVPQPNLNTEGVCCVLGRCEQMDYELIRVLLMLLDLKDEGGSLRHTWWERVSHA